MCSHIIKFSWLLWWVCVAHLWCVNVSDRKKKQEEEEAEQKKRATEAAYQGRCRRTQVACMDLYFTFYIKGIKNYIFFLPPTHTRTSPARQAAKNTKRHPSITVRSPLGAGSPSMDVSQPDTPQPIMDESCPSPMVRSCPPLAVSQV